MERSVRGRSLRFCWTSCGVQGARETIVVEYDPQWPTLFEKEAEVIRSVLGENCVEIHHIGNTSVVEMKGKPIIDIMPVVRGVSQVYR